MSFLAPLLGTLAPLAVDVVSKIFQGHGLIGGGLPEAQRYAKLQAKEALEPIMKQVLVAYFKGELDATEIPVRKLNKQTHKFETRNVRVGEGRKTYKRIPGKKGSILQQAFMEANPDFRASRKTLGDEGRQAMRALKEKQKEEFRQAKAQMLLQGKGTAYGDFEGEGDGFY